MARQPEFRSEEIEDLQQMLRTWWLEAATAFNPARGTISQFADIALDNKIRKEVAARRAGKRAWWLCECSLDDPVVSGDESGLTGHDVYDRADYFRLAGIDSPQTADSMELKERMAAVLLLSGNGAMASFRIQLSDDIFPGAMRQPSCDYWRI